MRTAIIRLSARPVDTLTQDRAVKAIADVTPRIERRLAALGIQHHDRQDILQEAALHFLQKYLGRHVPNPAGLLWVIAANAARTLLLKRRRKTVTLAAAAAVPDSAPAAAVAVERAEDAARMRAVAESALGRCPRSAAAAARLALQGLSNREIALELLLRQDVAPRPDAVARAERRVRVYLTRFRNVVRRSA